MFVLMKLSYIRFLRTLFFSMTINIPSAFSYKLISINILCNFLNVNDLEINPSTDDAMKDVFSSHFPPDSGSSTPKDGEPKVGNDDVDALKILVIVLIVFSGFLLVVLLILFICILTNRNCFKHSAYTTLEHGKRKSGDWSIQTVQTV